MSSKKIRVTLNVMALLSERGKRPAGVEREREAERVSERADRLQR